MPRTRRPQSGVARAAGRVASTTTSATKNVASAPVYRIPVGRTNPNCPAPTSEVGGTYPIVVQHRDNNVYIVSINSDWLKSLIEGYDSLDLSNTTLTLNTVEWPIELTGNLTVDGDFTWANVSATFISANSWDITSITSTDIIASAINTVDLATVAFTASGNGSIDWTLTVAWATTLNSTLGVAWNTTLGGNVAITGNETVWGNSTITWTSTANAIIANSWTITALESTNIQGWTITATNSLVSNGTLNVAWASTLANVSAANVNASWNLAVTWASTFTWDVSTNNLYSSGTASLNDVVIAWNETVTWTLTTNWATLLNSSLTVVWNTTMGANASVAGNLNVAWNETVTWTLQAWGDTTLQWKLNVSDVATFNNDVNVNDDLTVTWTSHLAWVETTWSVDVSWTIRTTWAINAGNGVYVTWQVESDSVVATNTTTDNLTVNWNISLWQNATASDFVLQSEKWVANGVTPLNANGKVDTQYLPEVFTTAVCKVVQWVFNNSNTAVVVDEDITNDAWVKVSNYQDIVGDTSEVISVGQIVVTSNTTETGSFKVLIVKPLA